jgi:CHAD domain-containing protein
MEVEAKFRVPDEATLEELETVTALAGYDVAAGERRYDADTFLDTPSRAFLTAGYFLRRRETDDGVKLTLKALVSDASGMLRREELEMFVAADVPVGEWPRGDLRERVEQIAAGDPLEPLLSLNQQRLARRVERDGREIAELSLDRVTAGSPRGDVHWFEVEAEARGDGSETDVAVLAEELRDRWALTPESNSKFARALELATDDDDPSAAAADPAGGSAADEAVSTVAADGGRLFASEERRLHQRVAAAHGRTARRARALLGLDGGATQAAAGAQAALSARRVRYWLARYRKEGLAIYGQHGPAIYGDVRSATVAAQPAAKAASLPKRPPITRDDTMTEAAVKTLQLHFAKMLAHEEGTRLGEDIEELHDMRVSTRRMRMALRVFADYLDPDVLRPVLKGLRRTGRTLGAVRDLDVFGEKTERYLEGLPPDHAGDLEGLLAAWRGERERQRERMVRYLDGPKYRRFVERTTEMLGGPVEHLAPARIEARPQRVAQVLPGVLYKDMGIVWAFDGQLDGLETPLPRFHALRIACKGLRYTLEFFEDVLGPDAHPLIKHVKGLQDHLGDLQDGVVTSGILRDFLTWGAWRHDGHHLPGPTEVIVAPDVARYLTARQEEMEHLVLGFSAVWPTVGGASFSKDLANLIAGI